MHFPKVVRGLAVMLVIAGSLEAAPLRDEIDRFIAAKNGAGRLADACDDATFVRRVYLDLAGRIPRVNEVRQFLEQPASPDKRTSLIDRLLASPEYPRRMEELFHVVLMERRGDHAEWSKFLRTSFESNKPWDQFSREIIFPVSDDELKRGAAFFQTRRLEKNGQQVTDYPGLTRDIGRLFMGIDLQCAQCHDHLFIKDYKQVDFQGLYTVFSKTSIRAGTAFPAIDEKPSATKIEFVSVFEGTKRETGPKVPFRDELELPPATGSALALIANSLPAADNRLFVQNAVNRFWFLFMGRGLVHPLDLTHGKNPPSHPELLDLLQSEFIEHHFDAKWLIREMMLTQTYARSSELSDGEFPAPETFAVAIERRLSAEQLLRSALTATGNPSGTHDETQFEADFAALRTKAVKAFGNPAKEPEDAYQASIEGALLLLNSESMLKLFEPRGQNLSGRVILLDDPREVANELYLAILIRHPNEQEGTEIGKLLGEGLKQRDPDLWARRIGQIAWALLASAEFSLNH